MKPFGLLALATVSLVSAPLDAGTILCASCIPHLDVYVNNSFLATIAGISNNSGATFSINALLGNPGQFTIVVSATTNPDPFVDYDVSVSNFSDSSTSFSLAFSSPTLGGPFTNTISEITTSVTDLGDDGASVVGNSPFPSLRTVALNGPEPSLLYTSIGGNPVGQVGNGCSAAAGTSQNCGTQSAVFNHNSLNGLLLLEMNFTLGPTDQLTVSAGSIVSPVPEPAAAILILGGLGLLAWRRSRA